MCQTKFIFLFCTYSDVDVIELQCYTLLKYVSDMFRYGYVQRAQHKIYLTKEHVVQRIGGIYEYYAECIKV